VDDHQSVEIESVEEGSHSGSLSSSGLYQ
jgi:hypothetical protein